MLSAIKAEAFRLGTLRSTLLYSILLTGALYGPPVLLVLFARDGDSAISTGDLGQCAWIFLLVAVVFAGASTVAEIRRGSTSISFLTQPARWTSFLARLIVICVYLTGMYIVGLIAAIGVSSLHPEGVDLSGGGWAYMGLYLLQILFWAAIAMSLAVLTRSTAASVTIPMAWLLLIESLLSAVPISFFQSVAEWTPSNNWSLLLAQALSTSYSSPLVPHGVAEAVAAVGATCIVFLGAGWYTYVKRDIPA